MPVVRALFRVTRVVTTMYDKPVYENGNYVRSDKQEMRTIFMAPFYSNDPSDPNKVYWDATPSGEIQLGTVNSKAWEQFELDKEYYIDFTPKE